MLCLLLVGDPGRLYRIGEGNNCCVEGGPEDRWGNVLVPAIPAAQDEASEIEEVIVFQAGRGGVSVWCQGTEAAADHYLPNLSRGTWQNTHGADTSVVGSTRIIEGHPFTVVGVAPAGFFGETPR